MSVCVCLRVPRCVGEAASVGVRECVSVKRERVCVCVHDVCAFVYIYI